MKKSKRKTKNPTREFSNSPIARIKVVGVGGGGGNAVSRMSKDFTRGVEFIAINTDHQDLDYCDVRKKIYIGKNLTRGLGTGMNAGMKAYFEEVNAKGGINGRKIKFVSANDDYEPDRTVDCTLNMIETEKVFCLAGYVGTPTTKAALPILQEMKIPLVGAFTGAEVLRNPVSRYVLNVRASYDDETEALVERMTTDLNIKDIAVFYQDDAFGLAGLSGTEKALKKRGMKRKMK